MKYNNRTRPFIQYPRDKVVGPAVILIQDTKRVTNTL